MDDFLVAERARQLPNQRLNDSLRHWGRRWHRRLEEPGKADVHMRAVPEMLSRQLGSEATADLAGLFEKTERDMTDAILTTSADRFERRLVEEISRVRVDLRDQKVELLKWSFLFWVGQVGAVAALFQLTGR